MVRSCFSQVGSLVGLPGWQGPETFTALRVQARMFSGLALMSRVPGMVSQVLPLSREYRPV